jgi:ABC-type glycerol-3-phosphate transport system substrate-binding protein
MEERMMRKTLFLVVLVLAAAMAWAAGSRASSSGVLEVTAVLQLNPEVVLENNPVVQMIERDLNIRFLIEAPPSTGYSDRVRMMVSTGEQPDLIHYGADIYATQWAQERLILDVTDRIANYPNLRDNITKEQYGDCVFLADGRIYGIPRPNSYDSWGFIINKKWLDKVGMQPPKTVAEFVEVCRAFTFNDPAGTGRRDTYGVSFGASANSGGISNLQNDFFTMAYGYSGWHAGMPDIDGSAKIKSQKALYPDSMRQLRAMYQEGIIDREFITHINNGVEIYEKLAQGRVGIAGASAKSYITNVLERFSMNMDDFIYCPPLVLDSTQKPMYAMPPSNWMAYYVKASASAEKQDAVLRILDWGNSEKGFIAQQFGIQGQHYNSYDINRRTVNRTDAQLEAFRKVSSGNFGFANAFKGLPPLQGGATPAQITKWQREVGAADAVTVQVYFPFTKMLDQIGVQFPDISDNLTRMETRYITGEVSWDQLEAYIRNSHTPAVASIAAEFAAYMARNPARYVNP